MRTSKAVAALAAAFSVTPLAWAAPAAPQAALARMPVKEITVFKDGNAFVLREGRLPTDANGDVLMDDLPTPILGAFWVYSTDPRGKVNSVSARPRRVLVERTALNLPELIEGNPGANVSVREIESSPYEATIVGVPQRSADELERTSPPNTGEKLPEKGNIVLLKTPDGTLATGVSRIQNVTFKGDLRPTVASEEFRNLLTVRLEGAPRPNSQAGIGMMTVERGVRWIPNYRVTLDGKGTATVALQATLVNDISDLRDVTMHLVIGVPAFAFDNTPDPMSLQNTFGQLSPYMEVNGRTNYAFSNAIMTQAAYGGGFGGFGGGGFGEGASSPSPSVPPLPQLSGSDRAEDLFVFTVKNVTLRKGERLVLPISERKLKYKDVYTLLLPFGPPTELRGNISSQQQAEVARILSAPKVQHKVRITNDKQEPLTTAPALIMQGGTVLAQGLMTYTPVSGEEELPVTTAVDVTAKKTERETSRTPDALALNNNHYTRVDLTGTIALANHRDEPVDLEVTRYVLGAVDSADNGGKAEAVNVFDDLDAAGALQPSWWGYYSWPYWWGQVNGVGRITWKLTLPAGASTDLGYTWHYFWGIS